MQNTLCKVADRENHVRWIYLTTVLCMGERQKYSRINLLSFTVYPSISIFLVFPSTGIIIYGDVLNSVSSISICVCGCDLICEIFFPTLRKNLNVYVINMLRLMGCDSMLHYICCVILTIHHICLYKFEVKHFPPSQQYKCKMCR